MYCLNCGNELPDHAKFCSKCGFDMKGGDETSIENTTQKKTGRSDDSNIFSFYNDLIQPLSKYEQLVKEIENLKSDANTGIGTSR